MINNDEHIPEELKQIMNSDITMEAIKVSQGKRFDERLIIKLDNCISLPEKERKEQLAKIINSQRKTETEEEQEEIVYL